MKIYIDFSNLLKKYSSLFYRNMLLRYINTPKYLEFIYLKGLFLIKNIYIFLHSINVDTNDIELLIEKAYVYFIEFIIQININSSNFELTLRDAVMFTYKKTISSYTIRKTNTLTKDFDNNLNILCNIFYITNNLNFIENLDTIQDAEESYINNLITNKLASIKILETKLLELITNNKDLLELNNTLLNLRDSMEKTIESICNTKSVSIDPNYNITMLNNIILIMDNDN
jgi:hypothetical protein